MSEVHREAQEEEDEATLAHLPFQVILAGRQADCTRPHTEMLDALDILERQPAAGNKDPLIVLLRCICMREIKCSLCQKDVINSPTRALHLIEVII